MASVTILPRHHCTITSFSFPLFLALNFLPPFIVEVKLEAEHTDRNCVSIVLNIHLMKKNENITNLNSIITYNLRFTTVKPVQENVRTHLPIAQDEVDSTSQ